MGTPRRNYNNLSPHTSSKSGQYPSQSIDYMSHHIGGMQSGTEQQESFGFYEDKRAYGGGSGCSSNTNEQGSQPTPHFYQNRSPHGQRQTQGGRHFGRGNRGRGSYQHRGGGGGVQFRNSGNAFSQYFHPSMLEDPWRDLMARHNAIYNINAQQEQNES